jgi:hypothetical protein
MRALMLSLLCCSSTAFGFCGFFVANSDGKLTNNASQVVLLRNKNRTVMTLSNNYQGPPEDFAMVVPVPVVLHEEDVKTLAPDVFDHIDALSAPRLVEYWEQDPCRPPPPRHHYSANRKYKKGGKEDYDDDAIVEGVKIEAQFAVGEYEILILSASESSGLEKWLRSRNYHIPDGAAEALAPYVRDQMKFFVAKVNIKKVHRDDHGLVVLSPLRFGFSSPELRLPVRLGLLNAGGKQDLIIYVLSPDSRYEVANYRNLFAPTNLDVDDQVRNAFAPFYAQLFDATLAPVSGKAVVTEYAWQTTSCDPCPTPPLSPNDLATLGEGTGGPNDESGYTFAPWVLTRLHARYDRQSLSEDLVFRAAPPIEGGRAENAEMSGPVEPKELPAGEANNYQARYIIRHYWKGAAQCAHPRWNDWGGPPDAHASHPMAARGLANTTRDKVSLKQVVRSPVPRLGLPGHRRERQ